MKLTLLSIHAANNPACMLIKMLGESGETYHFQGSDNEDQRVEDMLTHIAGEIAATRRKRPQAKYKVKSLMPKGWPNEVIIPVRKVTVDKIHREAIRGIKYTKATRGS